MRCSPIGNTSQKSVRAAATHSIFQILESRTESRYRLGVLRPQDILVLLKLALWRREEAWTFDSIAHELGLSASAVHRSVDRAAEAGLYRRGKREVERHALQEFLLHGLRYVYPAKWGGEARGIPTAWAAPPIADELSSSGKNPPVWPDAHGQVRGIALEPLHPAVPGAARRDKSLAELLALVDALRVGGARERALAAKNLKARLAEGANGA